MSTDDYMTDPDYWFLPKRRILWYWPPGFDNHTPVDRMTEIEKGVDALEAQIDAVLKELGLERRG